MMDSTKLSEALEWWKPHTPTHGRSKESDDWKSRYRDWMEDAGVISAAAQKFLALLPDEDGNYNPELVEDVRHVLVVSPLRGFSAEFTSRDAVRAVLDAITGNTE